ncbi:hypothetical protein KY285_027612 [Solanum tuberosum]|nr:hypothetical protein KY285_027612 [Solanum tuberosum]
MSKKPSEGNESLTATVFAESDASIELSPNLPLQSPEIGISDGLGESPASEGFSTTETGTPVHETMSGTIEER